MKALSIIVSIALMMLLASCGSTVEPTNTGTGENTQEQTPVVITPEEEELISELLEEVAEEEEAPAIDLATASFTGNGTEPFWGFTASGSTLILKEPSDSGPMDTTTFTGVVMSNVGTSVNMTASGMILNLTLETCSDGMSDIVYTYSSSFTAGATSYTGCAYVD